MDDEYDYLYKIVLVGDSAVGKSNILANIISRDFMPDSKATIGVEFGLVTNKIGGKTIKTQIWDTAGQERYRAISSAFYRRASGIILVFDITREITFNNLERWLNEVNDYVEDSVILIVGNKADLEHLRSVATSRAKEFCQSRGFTYMETSAKTGENVQQALLEILTEINQKDIKIEKRTEPVKKDIVILNNKVIANTTEVQKKPAGTCTC